MTNTTSINNNNNNNIYLKNTQKSNTIKIKIKPQTNSPVADCVAADGSKSKNTRDQVDSNRSNNKSKDTSQINILSPASILTKDILDNDDAGYCSSYALRSIQNKCNASILNESNQIKPNDNTTSIITSSTNNNSKQLFNTNNNSSNNRYSQITAKPNGKSSDIFSLSGRVMDNKNLKSSIVINTLQQTQSSPQTERQASYLKLACYLNGYDSFRSSAEKGDIKLTDERHEEERSLKSILPEKQDLNGLSIEAPKLDVKSQSIEEAILPIVTTVIEEVSLKSVEEKEIPALINDKLKETTDSDIINETKILSANELSNVDKEKNSVETVSEPQPVVQVMI